MFRVSTVRNLDAWYDAFDVKPGQRLYSNSGAASMGYDLLATIGAWHGMPEGSKRIICLAGDGSIMQNLQELQTIVGQGIPAKIFLYNNSGYHSIRQSQEAHFNGFSVGCGPDSGVTFPDFSRIAAAFGFDFVRVSEHADMAAAIERTLAAPGAAICEIMTDKATVEISSPKSGRVVTLHGKPGDVVKVHAPLVELDLGTCGAKASAKPEAAKPSAPAPSHPTPSVAHS